MAGSDSDQSNRPQRQRMVAPLIRRPAELGLPVRTVDASDLPDLAELMHDAYAGTIDVTGDETLAGAEEELRLYLAGSYGPALLDCSYLAEENGLPVGVALISLFEDAPLLAFAFTEPSWKNRGLATNLVQLSMNALSARGFQQLHLFVTVGNDPALRVYEKLGFQVS